MNRRDFVKTTGLVGAGALLVNALPANAMFGNSISEFTLPKLPYAYNALEPYIDEQTMTIHHSKHHQGYVNNLNKAIQEANADVKSLEQLLGDISAYKPAMRNNAGGHYNHSLFWELMQPKMVEVNLPTGKLADAITETFGSFEAFKTKFEKAGTGQFGSGWAWLVLTKSGKLEIGSTANQDNPLMDDVAFSGRPILALDVWEHAYYLKYQQKRADYIQNWWNVVNWGKVSALYSA